MIPPLQMILLGKISIILNSSFTIESAYAYSAGISATIFPAILDESSENRDLRGYEIACRKNGLSLKYGGWKTAESGPNGKTQILQGKMGRDSSSLIVMPGTRWHTVVEVQDPVYDRNDLNVLDQLIQNTFHSASQPRTKDSYGLGESYIATIKTFSNDYFDSSLKIRLPTGDLLLKVSTVGSNEKPVASDIAALKSSLGQNILSMSGLLKNILIKRISCKAVKYSDISGLETVSSIRLGDGKGADVIVGYYKIDAPNDSTVDIEAKMTVDRGQAKEAYAHFQNFIRTIRKL